jgi:dimethylhistidine N-methyltransferase
MKLATGLSREAKPTSSTFFREVCEGLASRPRRLPCKYLYDRRGSDLFEAICELDEYYPTRTELEIFGASVSEMAQAIGPGALVVEYGSGASVKTRRLLAALDDPVGLVAVDIAESALRDSARRLRAEFPETEILPVVADFTAPVALPMPRRRPQKRVIFFPGSTIGNFTRPDARSFLERQATLVGPGGGLLVGVDLKKDRRVLEAAYDDRDGVTAAFNLNILRHINRELGADFDLDAYAHRAPYRARRGRVEMWLVAKSDQDVRIGNAFFRIPKGEGICTEHSAKYSVGEFRRMLGATGFNPARLWSDPRGYFSVHYGEVAAA